MLRCSDLTFPTVTIEIKEKGEKTSEQGNGSRGGQCGPATAELPPNDIRGAESTEALPLGAG